MGQKSRNKTFGTPYSTPSNRPKRSREVKRRLYTLSGQRTFRPVRHRRLSARRRDYRRRRHGIQVRHRIGVESADGHFSDESIQRRRGAGEDRRRRYGTAFQLDHGDPARKGSPLDTAGKRRCDRRLLDDKPIGKPDAKWEAIQGFIEGLCGSSVEVIDELYNRKPRPTSTTSRSRGC